MTEGTYPVMIDGASVGKLTVARQGALTAFDVSCRALPGVVRLSVYGGGREGYLGVLAPENGGVGLHKKFSRNDLKGFPQDIESVESAGLAERAAAFAKEAPEPPKTAAGLTTELPELPEAPAEERKNGGGAAAGGCTAFPVLSGELPPCAEACGFLCGDTREAGGQTPETDCPAEAPEALAAQAADEDFFWYASPDGALVCFDGTRSLIALPVGDERIPEGGFGALRVVEGREYMIFRTRNGKLVRE